MPANYGVPTQIGSKTEFWGRKFSISIATLQGTFTINNSQYESLRVVITVDAHLTPTPSMPQATVTVYNLATAVSNQLSQNTQSLANPWMFGQPLEFGTTITISAGYQYGSTGAFTSSANLIFSGRVFQSMQTREHVTEYKLTLRCIIGLLEDLTNITSGSVKPGSNDYDTLLQMVRQGKTPIPFPDANIDAASKAALQAASQPGARSFNGRPFGLIAGLVRQHNIYNWMDPLGSGLNLRSFGPSNFQPPPAFSFGPPNAVLDGQGKTYSPSSSSQTQVKKTLIGTPEQTQDGVVFRVLLDSSVHLGDLVQLVPGTLISPVALQYGGQNLPPIPSQNGLYIVGGLKHYGDSRGVGDDWYTEINGLVQDYFVNFGLARTPGSQPGLGAGASK